MEWMGLRCARFLTDAVMHVSKAKQSNADAMLQRTQRRNRMHKNMIRVGLTAIVTLVASMLPLASHADFDVCN